MGKGPSLKFSLGPFDSARFAALAEGLEISVVKMSALERTRRTDSEFYRKQYLADAATMRKLPSQPLSVVASVADGNHFTISDSYAEEGVPYFRGQDVTGTFFADPRRAQAITRSAFDRPYMHRSHLRRGDVLLSIVGSIGSLSLVNFEEHATCSCKLAILRPKNISSAYLATFLASALGQNRIAQLTRGAVQKGLILEDADQISIPRFENFESEVDRIVGLAGRAKRDAESALVQAEADLLDALGLAEWSPPEPLTYTRSAADVLAAGRLDSQYFMPAKTQMIAALAALPGGTIGDSFDAVREMIDPKKGDRSRLVRNYDLTDALQPVLDASLPPVALDEIDSQKKRLRHGDLAVSRLRSYLREIAVVRVTDDVPAIGSSEYLVLRRRVDAAPISAEAMMIYLRAKPVQTILKWCQDGSQHPRFAERDLMSIPLPDAVIRLNESLTATVCSALEERARSIHLLAAARRAVEIAIEEGEDAATGFIARAAA